MVLSVRLSIIYQTHIYVTITYQQCSKCNIINRELSRTWESICDIMKIITNLKKTSTKIRANQFCRYSYYFYLYTVLTDKMYLPIHKDVLVSYIAQTNNSSLSFSNFICIN